MPRFPAAAASNNLPAPAPLPPNPTPPPPKKPTPEKEPEPEQTRTIAPLSDAEWRAEFRRQIHSDFVWQRKWMFVIMVAVFIGYLILARMLPWSPG